MLKQHELCDVVGVNMICTDLIFGVACLITVARCGIPRKGKWYDTDIFNRSTVLSVL